MIHGLFAAAAATLVSAAAAVSPASLHTLDTTSLEEAAPPGTFFVHGEGDDAAAGTRLAPLRTITAALSAARAAGLVARVRVSIGTYDAEAGEEFPLDLTGGVSLFGLGSNIAIIDAGSAAVALRLGVEAEGRAVLSGLSVRGSGIGLALGAAPEGSAAARTLALRDVLFEGLETGVALDLGSAAQPLPITLLANGMRTLDTRFGLRALGEGALELALIDCDLSTGSVGVAFESDPDENVAEARAADEEGVARVHHDVQFLRTRVANMTRAGVLRVGRDGRNSGSPYVFEDCTFERNFVGVEFQRPCLDSQVRFSRSRFLANEQFGVRLTGYLGPDEGSEGENVIEDCLFRWNGVGAHVTSSQLPFVVRRSRFLDNQGNGLFISNFLTDPTRVRIESSLFAQNGSHGIYSLADARLQTVSILHCTVVDNDAGGIRDHRRHSGSSNFELRACIIDGNGDGNDLVDVDVTLASHCLIGGTGDAEANELDAAFAQRGNLTAVDPGFVDRAGGDYRLGDESPCRGALSGEERASLPRTDLLGRSRPSEDAADDLGCYAER